VTIFDHYVCLLERGASSTVKLNEIHQELSYRKQIARKLAAHTIRRGHS